MRNSVRFRIILSLASISLARLASPAQAADLRDPSLYTGGLLDNTLSLGASGTALTFIDPDGSGCNYTGSFSDGTFIPTDDCNGDEFFNVDFTPSDTLPTSSSLGYNISSDFGAIPPVFNYGAEVLDNTFADFVYGIPATARGVAQDFFSVNPGQPSITASGKDLNLGAFTNPFTDDDIATFPMELFIELDPSSSTFPLPNGGLGDFYDRLYISAISQTVPGQTVGQFVFSTTLFGMASQIPVGGGNEKFIYNWQGVFTTQFASDADDFFMRTIRNGETVSTTTSVSVSFFPKTPEPSFVFGLLSLLGAGVFLKKKKQH